MIWCNIKRFRGTKSENLSNRWDKILFTASLVMRIDMDVNMVAVVGRRPLTQVLAQFARWASADGRPRNLTFL